MKSKVYSLIKIYSVTFRDYLLHPPLSPKKPTTIGKNEGSSDKSEKKEKKIKKVEMSDSRVRKFHKLFGNKFSEEEKLINYFSCAFVADILLQGHLYVSENHFSFYSNVFGYITKLVIPISTVKFVSKEKTAKMFPNAIGIQLEDAKHVFGSFLSREAAFQLMQGMVKKIQVPELEMEGEKTDEVDCLQEHIEISESSKEDSSSLSSESPAQFQMPPVTISESKPETPLIFKEPIEIATVEVEQTQSNTILFIGIALTLILAIFSIFLLVRINSIENRKSIDPLLRDYNRLTIDEAEQVLNRNLMTVRNVRQKLEELQMILETSFSDKNSKEEL